VKDKIKPCNSLTSDMGYSKYSSAKYIFQNNFQKERTLFKVPPVLRIYKPESGISHIPDWEMWLVRELNKTPILHTKFKDCNRSI